MTQRLGVQLKLGNTSFQTAIISTQGCEYVYDFKEAIKKVFSKKLKDVDAYELILFESDGATEIDPIDSINILLDKKMPLVVTVISDQVEANTFKLPLKRTRSASSISTRISNGSGLSQDSFRKRILARDNKGCVLTGTGEHDCDACHIIPQSSFKNGDFIGQEIWKDIFNYRCYNSKHLVMDVRNGILLWRHLHGHFDKLSFTIVKETDRVYQVVALREDEMEPPRTEFEKGLQITVAQLDGKKIEFEEGKKDLWPGEKFLQLHNRAFHEKREFNRLKAQAEAQELLEEDSAQTIANEQRESIEKVKNWNALFSERMDHRI